MLVTSRPRPLDADLTAYMVANLPVGYSYETLLAIANCVNYILEGGGQQLNVPFVAPGEVLTNMASAATLLRASPASAKKVDLTHYTECRIVAITGGVAGPTGAKVTAKFKTTLGANAAAYGTLGTSAVEALMETTDTAVTSAWIPLASAARDDVFIAIITSGGDGAIDPVMGNLEVQFR